MMDSTSFEFELGAAPSAHRVVNEQKVHLHRKWVGRVTICLEKSKLLHTLRTAG